MRKAGRGAPIDGVAEPSFGDSVDRSGATGFSRRDSEGDNRMIGRAFAAATLAVALSLSACGPMTSTASAQREDVVTRTGVVRLIDKESRRVLIEGPDRTVLYRIGPQVRNFDQVEVGDTVTLTATETVAVAMADAADTGEPLVDVYGARAPKGERPGAVAGQVQTLVVTFLGYNEKTKQAQIRLPDGEVRVVNVAPELQSFARSRVIGDRILVLIEQAVAISVTPAA